MLRSPESSITSFAGGQNLDLLRMFKCFSEQEMLLASGRIFPGCCAELHLKVNLYADLIGNYIADLYSQTAIIFV